MLVENTKFNSDRLLQKIGDILKAEYGAAETRMWRKHNASVPAHEEIIDGDPRDLRRRGRRASATEGPARRAVCSTESCWRRPACPRPSIVTDVFEVTGRAMAEQWGLPYYRFLAMPHPIANLTDAELTARAQAIAPAVARLLLSGQA